MVGYGRVGIARRAQPRAQRFRVVDLEAQVVRAGLARVRHPALRSLAARLVQREVHVVVAHVDPARAIPLLPLAADAEVGEGGAQETESLVDVADGQVGVVEADGHGGSPLCPWKLAGSGPLCIHLAIPLAGGYRAGRWPKP